MESWRKIILKAAGFGAGFAVAASILLGVAMWWSDRPVAPKAMSSQALVGSYSGMEAQIRGDAMHLTVTYGLHNMTDKDYSLPTIGALMSVNPENRGLDTLEGVTWDSTSVIPPGQTVNLKFDIPYTLSDYNKTAADMNGKAMVDFIEKRLKEIDGFRFFDYGKRYEIDLPKWPITKNAG